MSSFNLSSDSSCSENTDDPPFKSDSESVRLGGSWLMLRRILSNWLIVLGDKCAGLAFPLGPAVVGGVMGSLAGGNGTTPFGAAEGPLLLVSLSDPSSTAISASRSFNTSCSRIISFSRLCTERSFGFTTGDDAESGSEMDRFGRECGAKKKELELGLGEECRELDGECELLVEKEVLRECTEDSS
jgi:hypothetical protein